MNPAQQQHLDRLITFLQERIGPSHKGEEIRFHLRHWHLPAGPENRLKGAGELTIIAEAGTAETATKAAQRICGKLAKASPEGIRIQSHAKVDTLKAEVHGTAGTARFRHRLQYAVSTGKE